MLLCCLDLRARDADNIRIACIQGRDFLSVNVKACDGETLFAKEESKRQAYVAHSNNADTGGTVFDFLNELRYFACHDICHISIPPRHESLKNYHRIYAGGIANEQICEGSRLCDSLLDAISWHLRRSYPDRS